MTVAGVIIGEHDNHGDDAEAHACWWQWLHC